MDLTILDRLLLLGLLQTAPAEGDITMHRIVRRLRDEVGFTEQEHQEFNIVSDEGKVTWNNPTATKTIEMGPKALALIADLLIKASEAKTLRAEHIPLYDTFVGAEE